MKILGINGGVRMGYQDTSAALVIDGKLMAAVEEERLNRIKHAPGQLPEWSIRNVLASEGLDIHDIDAVASHGSTWGDTYEEVLRGYFTHSFGHCPKIVRVHHHDAHAASAFFASGFNEAMVLTMDSSGDGVSTQLAAGSGSCIRTLERFERPDSLGMFYSLITQFCGFVRDRDEYKLMGLAAYGDPERFEFDWLLTPNSGRYALNPIYFKEVKPGQPQGTRQEMMFSERLTERLGPRRLPHAPLTQFYMDVAAGAQRQLETTAIALVNRLHRRTGLTKLCLAGGVALNCVANGKLMNLEFIDDIYVQPGSSDAGISVGAALWVAAANGDRPLPVPDAYLGPSFSNQDIESALKITQLTAEPVDDPAAVAADRIAADKIVGWFQGRMEFGPRALGSRCILASALNPGMKDILNHKIKFRESFRPFCPSVREEDFDDYFVGKQKSAPYMTINYAVKPSVAATIPSVTHVDYTARIQTVGGERHPRYRRLLERLRELTGHGICLNTSFNVNNQPIVTTPLDAISTFYGSGMDCLVIGNYMLEKNGKSW